MIYWIWDHPSRRETSFCMRTRVNDQIPIDFKLSAVKVVYSMTLCQSTRSWKLSDQTDSIQLQRIPIGLE